ncbi:hypothetical protein B4091_2787 [Bacillus licheniformis]|nr:hypothetical protein B4091_2787 [Bacillus licheniformis]
MGFPSDFTLKVKYPILAAPLIWMEIAERRIQEWEKEK